MNSRIKENVHKLFEFWCEVTKTDSHQQNRQKVTGLIIESFPESFNDVQIISKIPDFAYPCEFVNDSVQSYSFVLTSDDSKWRFGFCRHDPKTQTAMVIITYLPWHDTFLRFLTVLGELRRSKNGDFKTFLSEAYNKGVPATGGSLKLYYNGGQNHFLFQRPSQFQLPSIPENHNLNLYYNFVDPKNMIAVFAAMLAERRIIFTSKRLDWLSSCIQAANAFLYPMVWQHIFIPVLPMKMKDILSAPMPYLIGVPEAVLQTMTPEELGEVVILNCDNKTFQSPFDDVRQMPPELVSQMKKQLSNSHDHIGDRVSKIFLGVLVQLIGGYRDAVRFSQDRKITWNREAFIETRPPHLRPFLTRMMELQIFQQFIDERLDMLNTGLGFSDEFELETLRYAEKMGKRSKNYKEFLRNVKDKTNPAVKSAVKSVKEGGRGVKTVYKDFKSKLRDITPPKSQFHTQISHPTNLHHHDALGHHRSAPNSPVFSKRHTNIEFSSYCSTSSAGVGDSNNSTVKKNPIMVMSSSNSQMLNGITNTTNNSSSYSNCYSHNNNNNHHFPKSPTISPSSSLCSSDMNISQELQNHPLFKSPTVDRSLKPSNSLDYSGYRTIRYGGAPLAAPPPPNNNITHQQHKTSSTPEVPVGNLCIIDDDDDDDDDDENDGDNGDAEDDDDTDRVTIVSAPILTTESIFDTPPDIPSPPVPPKRTNPSNLNRNAPPNRSKDSGIGTLPSGAGMSASYAFENNFVNSNTVNGASTTISPSKKTIQNWQVPIPAPRQKLKESPKSQQDTSKDLISLDDGTVSLDLEDFDPLNQNAKPIPSLSVTAASSRQSTKSTLLPSTANYISNSMPTTVVHNPLYPYFSPQHRNLSTTPSGSTDSKDDDVELLRKYGLDQFTLTSCQQDSSDANNFGKARSKSQWTTFD